ncbi:adenosylmethionine--8-amino-7-oxononanoate transaminase [Reichenbachiella versicolor]|uniref:adenosylmethionine--8-amino-7-oxononanoate transaminase n=1 Tax=Reichenbachiella versicolor TaxID=1821036 RepID=UPI000D6E40DF|nr:adenosylmethionine--8-amino-7-oxononanoate transaminase [Reichenbachiella versicolor]
MTAEELIQIDKDHVWHPYNSAHGTVDSLPVKSANGVYLELEDGTKLLDGMSSWWCTIHGYNVPELNYAIEKQLKNMAHVMFGGLTHRPAVELTKTLLDIVPQKLEHVFYSDSGSVSVEIAMKMALQYWIAKSQPEKNRFITTRSGYHGDTWHTMSVCDPINGMHGIFGERLTKQIFLPEPKSTFYEEFESAELEEVEKQLKKHHHEIAAFIIEPIVQNAGGMRFYHPEYLKGVKRLCEQFDILFIADEIATGFGRAGKLFACEYANITPDVMCIGKALTGGYMSFAATLCTAEVALTISDSNPGYFMHGPTFMANPLACSVARANIDLLLSSNWKVNVTRIEDHFKKSLAPLKKLNTVSDVRVLGAIGVIEMKEPVDMKSIQNDLIDQGVWLRPFGKLVYSMPPFNISDKELDKLTNGITRAVQAI